jgi:hypothetical protein
MQESAEGLSSKVSALKGFATALVNTDLTSPVWVLIGGADPALLGAVQAEQKNAAGFLDLSVMSAVQAAITDFAATFEDQSAVMLDVMTAAGDAPLTPTQQDKLGTAMATLLTALQAQQSAIDDKVVATKALSDQVLSPTGDLQTAIVQVQGTISSFKTKAQNLMDIANMPGGNPAAAEGAMAYLEGVKWLQGLLSTLQELVGANNQMSDALGGTQVIWRTLSSKYQGVQAELIQAGTDPTFVSVGDIKSAQLGWSQLAAYAAGSG